MPIYTLHTALMLIRIHNFKHSAEQFNGYSFAWLYLKLAESSKAHKKANSKYTKESKNCHFRFIKPFSGHKQKSREKLIWCLMKHWTSVVCCVHNHHHRRRRSRFSLSFSVCLLLCFSVNVCNFYFHEHTTKTNDSQHKKQKMKKEKNAS